MVDTDVQLVMDFFCVLNNFTESVLNFVRETTYKEKLSRVENRLDHRRPFILSHCTGAILKIILLQLV